jgi:site-specific recombinase XerD
MSLLRDRMVRDMERANLSERTKQQYLYGVRFLAQFHGKALDLLTPDDIRAWEDDMVRRGLGPNIRRVHLAAVAFLYRKTLSRPEMVSFLVRPRDPQRLPRVLATEEVGRILAAIREPRYIAFYALVFDTGLRISEAIQMKAGDVDRARGVIRIHGKGGRERQVKLGDRAYELLRWYWREVRIPGKHLEPLSKDSFLFVNRLGTPLNRNGARKALKLAAREAGISKCVTPHILRHSFATYQLESGTDLPVLQAQMGHGSIRSTQVYLHVSTRLIRQAPSPLDALPRLPPP